MTNENVLAGIKCLNCQSDGPFAIHAMAWFHVDDHGTDKYSDVTWGPGSSCVCIECGCVSTIRENTIKNQEKAREERARRVDQEAR